MTSIKERRSGFAKYKQDVKDRGKPFFPHAMFHDTVMSLVVVSVIIGLAAIWKWTASEEPGEAGSGWLGPLYEHKADSATTSFVPRPDWYFYFLFYLLRIFKWPDSVILGTVGIPTVLMILLIALPFVDVRKERRLLRRPVAVVAAILVVISMGVLTYKGAAAKEFVASEIEALIPKWQEEQNLPASALPGARLFAESGCLTCHVYLGTGSSNLGAPELTAEGAKGRGIQWQIDHLRNPAAKNAGSPMPSFNELGEANLRKLAIFLEASKGKR